MSGGLHREARAYCPETCPDVDTAFADAWRDLKEFVDSDNSTWAERILDNLSARVKEVGTERLREALCSAISDKNDAERERDELQDRVRELESEVDNLQSDVASLENELSQQEAA